MKKQPNKYGGGANTNVVGLRFEREHDIQAMLKKHPLFKKGGKYTLRNSTIIDRETNATIAHFYGKHELYSNFLKNEGIDYRKYLSKKLLPDEAILVGKTLYIIEKKFQSGSGSVDEKLQTCHFKKRQYTRLMEPLGIKTEFYFFLSDWFKRNEYSDVLKYIEEVGCRYFFDEIPLNSLGL
jgi:hypothetical protein